MHTLSIYFVPNRLLTPSFIYTIMRMNCAKPGCHRHTYIKAKVRKMLLSLIT